MFEPDTRHDTPESPQTGDEGSGYDDARVEPEGALWAALSSAGPDGVPVAELVTACGMGRRWVYYRLNEHATAGCAVQIKRGYWRATRPPAGSPGDGRPPPRPTPGRPRRTLRRHPSRGDSE